MREEEESFLLVEAQVSMVASYVLTADAARGCNATIIIVFKETIAIILASVLHTVRWWSVGDDDEGTMEDADDGRC